MDDADLTRYKESLRAMLAALAEEDRLGQDGRQTVMLDQQSVGRLSRMDALQQQAMAKATQARRAATGQRIRAALSRIGEGEFGYCSECGDPIAPGRLDLDPTVLTCVSCARG